MTDPTPTVERVLDLLRTFPDPETGRDVVTMDQVSDVAVEGETLRLTLALTTHSAAIRDETRARLIELLQNRFPAAKEVIVRSAIHHRTPMPIGQVGLRAKSVIAVGSGKGGVGKSTIAATLAYALSRCGSKVGLLDADVYGPSIPHLLGVTERPFVQNERIQPAEKDGIKVISMGLLVDSEEAVIWRGPMLHAAITQFIRDANWGELDYLIIDMPPGTGDIALTLSQLLPLTGAVVVCTPQQVALNDAIKAMAMFTKVKIPILGVVENMSGFICPDNGKRYDIFGRGGAETAARERGVPFLGEAPINIGMRIHGDEGTTAAVFDDETTAVPLMNICRNLVRHLADTAAANPPMPSLPVLG